MTPTGTTKSVGGWACGSKSFAHKLSSLAIMASKKNGRNGYTYETLNGSFRALELAEPNQRRTALVWPVRRHQQIAGKSVAHKDKLQSSDRCQNMTITLDLHESFMSSLGNFSFDGSMDYDSSGTVNLEEKPRRMRPAGAQHGWETKTEALVEIACETSESLETAHGEQLSPTRPSACQKPPRAVNTEENSKIWSSPLRRVHSDSPSRNSKFQELVTHRRTHSGHDTACSTPTTRTTTSIGLAMNQAPPIRRALSDSPGSGVKTPLPGLTPRKAYNGHHGSCRTPPPRRWRPTPAVYKSPLRRSRSEFPSPMSSRQGCNDSSFCLTPTSRTQSTTRHSSSSDLELRHILYSPRRTTSDLQGLPQYTKTSRHEESSVDERIALERQESEMLRYALNLSLAEK